MRRYLCPDGETLDVDMSGDLEVLYDSGVYTLGAEGFKYANAVGITDTFVPEIRFGGTLITLGNGTLRGIYSVKQSRSDLVNISDIPLDVQMINYAIYFAYGSTTSIGTGDLSITDFPFTDLLAHDTRYHSGYGHAMFTDIGTPANNRYAWVVPNEATGVKFGVETGAYYTHTSPFTWATGDTLVIKGMVLRGIVAV